MPNKKIIKYAFLLALIIITILISSVTPTAIDSWNLINSAKANLKTNDYKLYPGVGVALEFLFRGVNSNLSFELRYVLIAFVSGLATITLVLFILKKYYKTRISTALIIGLLTYLMGPFQTGGLYWDYFYLTINLALALLLSELPYAKSTHQVRLINYLFTGILAAFLLIGKQNSATLPMLFLILFAVVTGRFSNIKGVIVFSCSALTTLYIFSNDFTLVNQDMLTEHLTIPFRYSGNISSDTGGIIGRIIYRMIPLVYAYKVSIHSIAFYIYAIFQTLIMLILGMTVFNLIYQRKLNFFNTNFSNRKTYIYFSLVGIYILNIILLGRNWNEISTLAPILTFIVSISWQKKILLLNIVKKIYICIAIVFFSICVIIPIKNYMKIYNNEYGQPYGIIVMGAYATGNYVAPKDVFKLINSKKCVGGLGERISPLLYLGSSYCSNLIQVEQFVISRDIEYNEIIENCSMAKYFKEFKLIDFTGPSNLIYKSDNINFYLINE